MRGAGIAAQRRTVIWPVPCQLGLRLRRIEIGSAREVRAQGQLPPIEPTRRGGCQSHTQSGGCRPRFKAPFKRCCWRTDFALVSRVGGEKGFLFKNTMEVPPARARKLTKDPQPSAVLIMGNKIIASDFRTIPPTAVDAFAFAVQV